MLDLLNLPFGWVSVCAITLLSVLCIAWVINWLIQCYMELVLPKFVDDIKFLQTNYVGNLLEKLLCKEVSTIFKAGRGYLGYSPKEDYVTYREGWADEINYYSALAFAGKYETIKARMEEKGYPLTRMKFNPVLLLIPVIIDTVIWLYLLNPFFTTLALLFVGVTYSIRFISTKLYTTMNKTTNHEERINKLEDNEQQMITLFILQFLATFSIVGFRLLQNLNSVNSRYMWMLPTTLGIALSEIYIIDVIANGSLDKVPLIIAMTLGGWLGCVGATLLNNYLKKKHSNKERMDTALNNESKSNVYPRQLIIYKRKNKEGR